MDRATLPDLDSLDRDALVELVLQHQQKLTSLIAARDEELRRLEAELDSHRQTLSEQTEELCSRSERIEHLKLMVEKLRHMIFGAKSEKIVVKLEQLELELEDTETTHAELEAAAERLAPAKESKAKLERKPLPEHLPREVVTHAPNRDCCPDCGGQLRRFGEDVSEQLEYIPESFKVIRHVRPKFACTGCDRIVESPAPSRPIERGLAGPGLLAHVIVSKFADHLPLYRQSDNRALFVRDGAPFDRPIQAGVVRRVIRQAYLRCGLAHSRVHILRHSLASRLLKTDTPLKEIADIIRHRSLDTSVIYTKVDTNRLAAVAMPWPGRSL